MLLFISLVSANDGKSFVVFPNSFFNSQDIIPRRLILNFGAWKREVEVHINSSLTNDRLEISKEAFNNFDIPTDIPYEIYVKGRNLQIGPVIAFIPISYKKNLTPELLENYKGYFTFYENIKGLVYICATDGINISNKIIEGFYYKPNQEKTASCWQKGKFPYPGAIYRKTGIPKKIYDDLVLSIGDNIFNGYFFNKWDLWKWLSVYPNIKKHLPHTEKLNNRKVLDDMLNLYPSVYLKRIFGQKAQGIIKVKKSDKGYQFIYRLRGEKEIETTEDVDLFIKELIHNTPYIIQQTIPTKTYENRTFDFRVIMQKNNYGKWICPGIIARFGAIGSIATNFLLSGFALPGKEALKKVFNLKEQEVFKKEQEIINSCTQACEVLDNSVGNFGDLGIDIILDEELNVWILEINKLHDHKFPLYSINSTRIYTNVITNPFDYAKYLAGFVNIKDRKGD